MAKKAADSVYQAATNKMATANQMSLCEGEPADRTAALLAKGSGGNSLGIVDLDPGDFTQSAGDTDGWKVTVAAKTGISITDNGTVNHIALVDATELLGVTTSTNAAVTAGQDRDTEEFDFTVRDVT